MAPLPLDPDSDPMGYWVDRWLQDMRQHGATSRELERAAQRLANAVENPETPSPALEAFLAFVSRRLVTNYPPRLLTLFSGALMRA